RRALRALPCHGCEDREAHARWAERYDRLDRETDMLRQQVAATTHSLARTFDRIRALLAERGYLGEEGPTEHGRRLARLWARARCAHGGRRAAGDRGHAETRRAGRCGLRAGVRVTWRHRRTPGSHRPGQ